MSEIKLKPLTHKARKDYIKEMRRIGNLDGKEEDKYDLIMDFREETISAFPIISSKFVGLYFRCNGNPLSLISLCSPF